MPLIPVMLLIIEAAKQAIIQHNRRLTACLKVVSSYKSKDYPGILRVVRYYDEETRKTCEFMSNNFNLSAKTIADIYKSGWDIELFFKLIKQNLKVKTFIGTSENAVKIQVWTAMIVYLLTEYIRFKSRTSVTILKVFRILSENILYNADIYDLLMESKPPSQIKIKKM